MNDILSLVKVRLHGTSLTNYHFVMVGLSKRMADLQNQFAVMCIVYE